MWWPYLLSLVTLVVGVYVGHFFTRRRTIEERSHGSQKEVATKLDEAFMPQGCDTRRDRRPRRYPAEVHLRMQHFIAEGSDRPAKIR
jgi:hypothetical protein